MKFKKIFTLTLVCIIYTTAFSQVSDRSSEKLCFLTVTEGKPIITNGDTIQRMIDSLIIKLNITGNNVEGIYHWLPAQKDKRVCTLSGTIKTDTLKAIFTCTGEGMTQKQERMLLLKSNEIIELVCTRGCYHLENGIYKLKSDKLLKTGQATQKVPCK